MTQLPTLVYLTVEPFVPETLQTPASVEESTEKTTGLPDAPPVANSVAVPPTKPEGGAVKLIVWEAFPTVIDRVTVFAAV